MPRHSIYTNAIAVLIGLDAERSHAIIGGPVQHAEAKATIEGLAKDSHLSALAYFKAQALSDNSTSEVSSTFGQILDSSWFDRTWVVQETCLAKRAVFLCPWGELEWRTFHTAFVNYNKHSRGCCRPFAIALNNALREACHRMYLHVKNIEFTRSGVKDNKQHIIQAMLNYQHLEVSNHKDKIYAFRALHTEPTLSLPQPNYKSAKDAFRDFTLWYLEHKRSLHMLGYDMSFGEVAGLEGFSTWIPTWPTFSKDQGIGRGNIAKVRARFLEVYNAAHGLEWSYQWKPGCPDRLRLHGLKIDDPIVARAEKHPTGKETFPERVNMIKAWYQLAYPEHAAGHLSFENMHREFCATMFAGVSYDSEKDVFTSMQRNDCATIDWIETLTGMEQDGADFHGTETQQAAMHLHAAAVLERVMFRTKSGRIGLGPRTMELDDEIYLLAGGTAPFLLRPVPYTGLFKLVGPCYINGIMNGEFDIRSGAGWVHLI